MSVEPVRIGSWDKCGSSWLLGSDEGPRSGSGGGASTGPDGQLISAVLLTHNDATTGVLARRKVGKLIGPGGALLDIVQCLLGLLKVGLVHQRGRGDNETFGTRFETAIGAGSVFDFAQLAAGIVVTVFALHLTGGISENYKQYLLFS